MSRTAFLWIVYAAIIGFVVGASFFSPQIPPTQTQTVKSSNGSPGETRSEINAPKSSDDKIATYTGWLAAFTLALVVISAVQIHFLIRSDETSRITAESAKRSADAAIAIELPLIRADVGKLGTGLTESEETPLRHFCWMSEIKFWNFGRTKALPIEVEVGLFIGDRLPDIPKYTSTKKFRINEILEPNPTIPMTVDLFAQYPFDAPAEIYARLRAGDTFMWFYCNFVYLDFMGNRHETGFCWERFETIGMGSFKPDPIPAYNRKT